MKKLLNSLLFCGLIICASAAHSAAAAGTDSGALGSIDPTRLRQIHDRFSANIDLYGKVKSYLVSRGALDAEVVDDVLPYFSVFSSKWGDLAEAQRTTIYGMVFPDEVHGSGGGGGDTAAAAAASSGGSAAASSGSSDGSAAAASGGAGGSGVKGALTKPSSFVSNAWYGVGASHLYRENTGGTALPRVPLIHAYNPQITSILFAGKFDPEKLALPAFVTRGGMPESVYVVVMPSSWSEKTLFRPHYAIHTKDDQKMDVTFSVGESDFGASGSATVEMHTHWKSPKAGEPWKRDVVASPDAGAINLGGKAAKDIGSGSFWVVANYDGKKIATFYWLVNEEAIREKVYDATSGAGTIEEMIAMLNSTIADNPQFARLKALLKYS